MIAWRKNSTGPYISQEQRGATGRRSRRSPSPQLASTIPSSHFQLQGDRLSRLSCSIDAGLDELDRLCMRGQKEAVRPHKHVPLHQSSVEEAIVPVQTVHDHGFSASSSSCSSSASDSSVLSGPDEDAKQLGGLIIHLSVLACFLSSCSCSPPLQKIDVGFN